MLSEVAKVTQLISSTAENWFSTTSVSSLSGSLEGDLLLPQPSPESCPKHPAGRAVGCEDP